MNWQVPYRFDLLCCLNTVPHVKLASSGTSSIFCISASINVSNVKDKRISNSFQYLLSNQNIFSYKYILSCLDFPSTVWQNNAGQFVCFFLLLQKCLSLENFFFILISWPQSMWAGWSRHKASFHVCFALSEMFSWFHPTAQHLHIHPFLTQLAATDMMGCLLSSFQLGCFNTMILP